MRYKNLFFISLFFSLACSKPDIKTVEYNVLLKFLEFDSSQHVTTSHIEQTLYDIQSSTDTMGRAFRITKYLFLTNYHVIASTLISGKYSQLVKQAERGFLQNKGGEFAVVAHDKTQDIALLQLKDSTPQADKKTNYLNKFWDTLQNYWKILKNKTQQIFTNKLSDSKKIMIPEDQPYFHLYNRVLKEKEAVTEFIRFNGDDIKHIGYQLKFGGFDLYDKKKYVEYLGDFVLPPNSALFEKKGYVLPFQEKEIAILTEKLPSSSKREMITSIPVYQGESGSPVFLEEKKNHYYLAGITTKTLSAGDTISTPGHPLGILAYERTVSFIIHRDAILKFIQNYLKVLKTNINSKAPSL